MLKQCDIQKFWIAEQDWLADRKGKESVLLIPEGFLLEQVEEENQVGTG